VRESSRIKVYNALAVPFFYMEGNCASSDRMIEMGDIICDEVFQKNGGIDTF